MVRSIMLHGGLVLGLLAAFPVSGKALDASYELHYDDPIRWKSARDGYVALDGCGDPAEVPSLPALPWRTITIPESWPTDWDGQLSIVAAETLLVPGTIIPGMRDWITSDTATPPPVTVADPGVYALDAWYPAANLKVEVTGLLGSHELTAFSWCPFRYNPVKSELVVIRRGILSAVPPAGSPGYSPPADTVPVTDALAEAVRQGLDEAAQTGPPRSPADGAPGWVWPGDPPLGVSYVVVTRAAYKLSLRPLVEWKARRGVTAGLATIEAITASYPGVDDAEAIRNYLKAAFGQGLSWVVLAGDETVVPVRYAYAGFESNPTDLYDFQICDLYYGELDGNWDADGDGIWGEFLGDSPQLYPELYVGRLPFSNASEVAAVVNKIIAYERGPADGSYLTRSLNISADQMRDWSSGIGQHGLVVDDMPLGWTNDVVSMVETPSGEDLAPYSPEGSSLPGLLASGAGWVNYFVHGAVDGFVVKSPGILESPRSWVYTYGSAGDGYGHLNTIAQTGRPGIHLSVACDQGGIDMDAPPFSGAVGRSVAEGLLLAPNAGAVAFIAQSRWGWVSSSYKLVEKFYAYVKSGTTPNHVGVYQVLAKTAFPSYRDLNYGNNLYGDPEMPVWKSAPLPLGASTPAVFSPGAALGSIQVWSGTQPVSGALVTMAAADSVWTVGISDGSGNVPGDLIAPDAGEIILTVSKSGYRLWADTIPVSIIADIFDEEDDAAPNPDDFRILGNYPNPFNAGTVLPLAVPAGGGTVILTVHDILGRTVRVLRHGVMSGGTHFVEFDGTDDRGVDLASGVYFARMRTGTDSQVRKMVLLR